MLELRAKKDELMGFFRSGLWEKRLGDLSGAEALYIRALRVLTLSVSGFLERNCTLRASALTFYSLLGVVPVLAIAFGIAKGFGLRQRLRDELLESLSGQEEVISRVIDFADKLLESTKGGLVAGVGVAVLIWSVMKVFGHVEESFNAIWEVREKRALGSRFTTYLSIMLISPVVIIISGSLTVFVSSQVTSIVERFGILAYLGPVVMLGLELLPYVLMWLLLAFVYISLPNVKVRFLPGVAGAVVAGTVYQTVQWVYVTFQIGIANYNAVYGSFAAIPLFLVWLNLSWTIVLFGSQLACAVQNVESYDLDPMARQASPLARKRMSLLVAHLVVKSFVKGEGPVLSSEIAGRLGLPSRLLDELLAGLVEAGVLNESVRENAAEPAFQPRHATETITIGSVLEALDSRGSDVLPMKDCGEAAELTGAFKAFQENLLSSPANRLLRDI